MHHFGRFPVFLLVAVAIMAMRIYRLQGQRGPRGLRLDRLWLIPAIVGLGVVLLFSRQPPRGEQWLFVAVAALLGAATGWWRAGAMHITINPRTNRLNQQATPAAIYFLVGLFAVRIAIRFLLIGANARALTEGVTDALAVFVFMMFSVQRLGMYLRGRRMLAVGAYRV